MIGVRPGADTTVPFWKYLLGIEISACHRWRVGAAGRFVRTYKEFDRQCKATSSLLGFVRAYQDLNPL